MRYAVAVLLLSAATATAQGGVDLPEGPVVTPPGERAPDRSLMPRSRPDPEVRLPADEPEIDARPVEPPTDEEAQEPLYQRIDESQEDFAACLSALEGHGANFTRLDPIRGEDPDCGIERPVEVTQVIAGVEISPALTVRCATALGLAEWIDDIVQPAARKIGRGALVGVDHASGYVCRRRATPEGKMSEHAFGNAVDIVQFRFSDGDPIRVEPRERTGTLAESFQRAARAGACLDFTTVLGPGTDEAHADHLHMDIKLRSGEYRLCQ